MVTAERFEAQGLLRPKSRSPQEVVARLLAVQAQDPRGTRLAIRPRLAPGAAVAATADDVDRAFDEGAVVVGWLNRGTLHQVRAEDYRWLHAITSPPGRTSNRTRLHQEGVSAAQAERGAGIIVRLLADGPAGRNQIRERLQAAGIPVAGQALPHILYFASIQGLIVRGPMIGGEQAFVLAEEWLGPGWAPDPDLGLSELACRYLAGHGPAEAADLAKWAGIPLGMARRALDRIAGRLVERPGGLVALKERRAVRAKPRLRLLGAFDPLLHGWKSREFIIPDPSERKVVTTNGLFRPTVLADGQVVATWRIERGKVTLNRFRSLTDDEESALTAETESVLAYLGL